jgi:integrase
LWNTHAVLFSALREAVRWKFLLTNPAEDVHLPRQPRRSFTVLDVKDARQFIAAISGHEYEALFALAITTGMRPSECLALTWSDIDLERGTVSVSKTLEWRERSWHLEDTKRERSRRMIKLQNWVVAFLRRSSEKARSTGAKPSDVVFTSNP